MAWMGPLVVTALLKQESGLLQFILIPNRHKDPDQETCGQGKAKGGPRRATLILVGLSGAEDRLWLLGLGRITK